MTDPSLFIYIYIYFSAFLTLKHGSESQIISMHEQALEEPVSIQRSHFTCVEVEPGLKFHIAIIPDDCLLYRSIYG